MTQDGNWWWNKARMVYLHRASAPVLGVPESCDGCLGLEEASSPLIAARQRAAHLRGWGRLCPELRIGPREEPD
eukprot:9476591-Pyramimonas_sp.AAC.1